MKDRLDREAKSDGPDIGPAGRTVKREIDPDPFFGASPMPVNRSPRPPDTDPTVGAIRELIAKALVGAQAIDHKTDTVLARGYTTHQESKVMQVWRNDAAVAYSIVEYATAASFRQT